MLRVNALITGITGQDGCTSREFLLAKGYDVYGVIRRSSSFQHCADRWDLSRSARRGPSCTWSMGTCGTSPAESSGAMVRPDEIYTIWGRRVTCESVSIFLVHCHEITALGTVRLLKPFGSRDYA